jgi:hypothetical protein
LLAAACSCAHPSGQQLPHIFPVHFLTMKTVERTG